MKIQLIRNATLKVTYGNKTILVDPMLCDKDAIDPFVPGLARNPTVDLPISIPEVLQDVDAVLVTHSHLDHFDLVAEETLSKTTELFCTPVDESAFAEKGYDALTIENTILWHGIRLTRIEGVHGSGPILPYMGEVSGYILEAENEPTVYLVSDTILCEAVKNAIDKYSPDLIITNSGGGIIPGFEAHPVIMDGEQTCELWEYSGRSTVIAVHLESIDFCRVTRKSLRLKAESLNIPPSLFLIPDDGQSYQFQKSDFEK